MSDQYVKTSGNYLGKDGIAKIQVQGNDYEFNLMPSSDDERFDLMIMIYASLKDCYVSGFETGVTKCIRKLQE